MVVIIICAYSQQTNFCRRIKSSLYTRIYTVYNNAQVSCWDYFLSQSSPLCDNGEKTTVIRLAIRIDGLFDGNKICQLFHRFPLQLQRRMNISIHCDGNR